MITKLSYLALIYNFLFIMFLLLLDLIAISSQYLEFNLIFHLYFEKKIFKRKNVKLDYDLVIFLRF